MTAFEAASVAEPIGLPAGWTQVRLGDVCEINPKRPPLKRTDSEPTSFVPMSALAEEGRGITGMELRPFSDVRKGYTFFSEGDILFAKITPCMQNGKHAIATGLDHGFGFGSTEFHVLRTTNSVIPEWVHLYLIQPSVLRDAEAHLTGAVGQQRLPERYLSDLKLPLPPVWEQQLICAAVEAQIANVDRARASTGSQWRASQALLGAYLEDLFRGVESKKPSLRRLGDILTLRKEVVHPRDNPSGPATFVGLEHVESLTGHQLGSLHVEMSALTGRKPRFYTGDLVYGYLRPYLNKVWLAEFDGLCSVDQYVFSVNTKLAMPEYIAWFMRSPVYLRRAPITTTPGQLPRIRTDEVANVELPLPSVAEQRLLVDRLTRQVQTIERLTHALSDQQAALDLLPAAIMRDAFRGRYARSDAGRA